MSVASESRVGDLRRDGDCGITQRKGGALSCSCLTFLFPRPGLGRRFGAIHHSDCNLLFVSFISFLLYALYSIEAHSDSFKLLENITRKFLVQLNFNIKVWRRTDVQAAVMGLFLHHNK